MHITNCVRNIGTHIRNIRNILPQASMLLDNTAKAVRSTVGSISVFGPTGEEIVKDVDLAGKTCLITGANSGIGLEMTRCLSARDCTVLMGCRNTYAANIAAKNHCENLHRLNVGEVNLASLRSVKNYADQLLKEERKIDMVILNAGVFGIPWTLTEDGLETIFQVNFLSQWYLLQNIEKILAPDARVVFVSSESHRNVNWSGEKRLAPTEEQLSLSKEAYTSIKAFNVSKLCALLGMHYLRHRWAGAGASAFCAHPGSFVRTRLSRNWWPYEMLYMFMQPFTKSVSQAASTPLYCATSADLAGVTAVYVSGCRRRDESELARDSQLAFRVVDLAQGMLRQRVAAFDPPRAAAPAPADKLAKEPVEEEQNLISNYSG